MSDDEWRETLELAASGPDDWATGDLYASVAEPVFEAAIALCRATGDLSSERLRDTLLAVTA